MLLCCGIRRKRSEVAPAPPCPDPRRNSTTLKQKASVISANCPPSLRYVETPAELPPAGHQYYPLFRAVRQSKGDFCNRRSQNNCSSGRSTYNKLVRLYAGSKWRQIHQRQMHTFPPHNRNFPLPKPPTLKLFCERRIWLSGETPLGMRLGDSQVEPVSNADPERKCVALVRCVHSADGWRDEETQNQRVRLSIFWRIKILYARGALPAVVACSSTLT